VFRDIGRFQPRGDGSFFAWLRTIADHRLIDALRKLDRGGAHQLSAARFGSSSSIVDLVDVVCHDSDSPSKHVRKQEAARAMQVAIAGLPEDQKEVIRLHCLEQKPVEEIARETGRTDAAVRGLIHRGKKNLAEAMGRSSRWLSSR
jgi:RNA polymerase sigma factor (sigma-70 family)